MLWAKVSYFSDHKPPQYVLYVPVLCVAFSCTKRHFIFIFYISVIIPKSLTYSMYCSREHL